MRWAEEAGSEGREGWLTTLSVCVLTTALHHQVLVSAAGILRKLIGMFWLSHTLLGCEPPPLLEACSFMIGCTFQHASIVCSCAALKVRAGDSCRPWRHCKMPHVFMLQPVILNLPCSSLRSVHCRRCLRTWAPCWRRSLASTPCLCSPTQEQLANTRGSWSSGRTTRWVHERMQGCVCDECMHASPARRPARWCVRACVCVGQIRGAHGHQGVPPGGCVGGCVSVCGIHTVDAGCGARVTSCMHTAGWCM